MSTTSPETSGSPIIPPVSGEGLPEGQPSPEETLPAELLHQVYDPRGVLEVKEGFDVTKKFMPEGDNDRVRPASVSRLRKNLITGYVQLKTAGVSLTAEEVTELEKGVMSLMNKSNSELKQLAQERADEEAAAVTSGTAPEVEVTEAAGLKEENDTEKEENDAEGAGDDGHEPPMPPMVPPLGGEGDGGAEGDDIEADEEPEPFEKLTSPKLERYEQHMRDAKQKFVEISAGRRGVIFSRKYSKAKLEAAQKEYAHWRDMAGLEAVRLLQEDGQDDLDIFHKSIESSAAETLDLYQEIYEHRAKISESKRLSGFYKWWEGAGSPDQGKLRKLGKTAAKALILAGIGLPIGIGAGLIGATFLGPLVGGVAAAGIAKGVSKGLIGAHIHRNSEGVMTGSQTYSKRDANRIEMYKDRLAHPETVGLTDTSMGIAEHITRSTKESVTRNRRRTLASAAGGAALGMVGASIFHSAAHAAANNTSHQPPIHSLSGGNHGHSQPPLHNISGKSPVNMSERINAIDPSKYETINGQHPALPWNYYNAQNPGVDRLGDSRATDVLNHVIEQARSKGWTVNTSPAPGGYEINNIIAPNGRVFTGTAAEVAALEFVRNAA